MPGAEIAAVGSRSQESADEFARAYGASVRAHPSYESLVADPDVDVVYIATPHAFHLENARAAFDAGKHVLCEKPLTLNLAEAEAMVAAADAAGRFLMEAMWMACNPVIRAVRDGIAEGRFGTPRQVHADLGFVVNQPPTGRLFNPELGGGALLDMGIYPLTFAHLMLGPADRLVASATLSDQGVDLDVALAGRHGEAVSALTASMTSASPCTATIATADGRHRHAPRLPRRQVRHLDARRAGSPSGSTGSSPSSAPGWATKRPTCRSACTRAASRVRWSRTTRR